MSTPAAQVLAARQAGRIAAMTPDARIADNPYVGSDAPHSDVLAEMWAQGFESGDPIVISLDG